MANTTADKLAKLSSTKAALKSAINGSGSTVGDVFSEYPTAITSGKSAIAQAITDKGVTTAADATFQQMADNVESIQSGGEAVLVSLKRESLMPPYEYIVYYCNIEGGYSTQSVNGTTTREISVLKNTFLFVTTGITSSDYHATEGGVTNLEYTDSDYVHQLFFVASSGSIIMN